MTATAYSRGNPIRRNTEKERWEWEDGTPIEPSIGGDVSRPCTRCGLYPTQEGHDACIGHVEGVTTACCGHGVEEPFVTLYMGFKGEEEFKDFKRAVDLAKTKGMDLNAYIVQAVKHYNNWTCDYLSR